MKIPPDAVRVWRGFRNPSMELAAFLDRLGSVFVPATVELQIAVGLDGYVPSIPGGLDGKPGTVPDETAILFWDAQQTYTDGFETLAVRTYTLTHAAVYTPASRADFPVPFAGELAAGVPCHLLDEPADWMHGEVTHLVGARPDGVAPDDFRARAARTLNSIKAGGGIAGAIACAGDDYLVYWALGAGRADELATGCGWSHVATAAPTRLGAGLWDRWPGLTIASGDSLNMQFTRRWEQGEA